MSTLSTNELANRATHALLMQVPLEVTHADGWQREGFPLPIKRMPVNDAGEVVQQYRPIAILEYVQEVLSGQIAARQARDRAILAKKE